MCGIVGAVAQRNVAPILLEGLKRLEYRGYDSAGIAILDPNNQTLQRIRTQGKVCELADVLNLTDIPGHTGIAHTRWATHGKPSELNAHPHISNDYIAIVHNGIIENHALLRAALLESGYSFSSETDTEVGAHIIHQYYIEHKDILAAVQAAVKTFKGAYALGIMIKNEPNRLIAVRSGCPLVVGLGIKEHFFASDPLALMPVAQQFIYLEEGDIADVRRDHLIIYDNLGNQVSRKIHTLNIHQDSVERGPYRHYMLKEIFDQPQAIRDTLDGRLDDNKVIVDTLDKTLADISRIERVQIVACGTSYHAAMVGRYWLESLAGLPCQVEIASENRYRQGVVEANSLFVCISQSGETADTLASLRQAKSIGHMATLGICNVSQSSLVRESDLILMTRAGMEIGVASTKAFTTQLATLFLLTLLLGRNRKISAEQEQYFVQELRYLPSYVEQALALDDVIRQLARKFIDKQHALFLGRGLHFPIAMEGALKLKEISYIHAEAYPAGELKHGPLALVDKEMPVIAVAPNDELLEKLKSNICEVQARGGELIIFADQSANIPESEHTHVFHMPTVSKELAPILYTIPLQLLAYHVAVLKGTDVDQPRNLAKSVTVE
ncbi:MAG: glutamine--fructose-6-phosphate transaminase (isomerizing) [Gammaproteobacteria bacterium]|nr:glutamine--fructose-6-phosphate transaminase (isomerizing) [Gammaproteobacteria bacterium]